MRDFVNLVSAAALIIAQFAVAAPAWAQQPADRMTRPVPQPQPQIQPPVTLPAPVRPGPGNRPRPPAQPVRPVPPIAIQPPAGGNNPSGGNWNGNTIRCESQNYRYRECRADTRGGVRLVRVRGGRCVQGQSWGYRPNFIWVNNGCRADFQTRNWSGGGSYPGNNNSGGPSAGAVIGGVAVAAGLIAMLSQSNNRAAPPQQGNPAPPLPQEPFRPPAGSSGAPARINASTGGVTPSARPSLNTCLAEAARQIGATGGTEIILDRLDNIEPGNGGYRFRFQLKAVYPDETRTIPTFCRATPTTLVELTFG